MSRRSPGRCRPPARSCSGTSATRPARCRFELDALGADFAVGCGVQVPQRRAPARRPGSTSRSGCRPTRDLPLTGWHGHARPFELAAAFEPAGGIERARIGTPPLLSMLAFEAALDVWADVSLDDLRAKSLGLTRFVDRLRRRASAVASRSSPRATHERRGSQVALRMPITPTRSARRSSRAASSATSARPTCCGSASRRCTSAIARCGPDSSSCATSSRRAPSSTRPSPARRGAERRHEASLIRRRRASFAMRSALGPADVGRPAELLEDPDDAGRDVELAAQHAVPGRGRVGVVQVVPALAEAQDRQRPEVRALVAGRERTLADRVADRVDRPGDVVQQADADERGPEERRRARPTTTR